jgi:sugar phosphate isomerase/epimerase
MPILSMNEVTTYRWSLRDDVTRYAEAGYEGIGVWRQKLADFGELAGLDLLAESGLKVTNLLWAGGFTGSDGRSFAESLQDAMEALRLAADLRAPVLVVYPGGRNNHTHRHAERLLRTALDSLLDLATAAEVTLAIEPMHPACAQDWTFLCDLEATVGLIDSFASPQLRLVLDAYHFGAEELLPLLPDLASYVGIVHLGDRKRRPDMDQQRCLLGEGQVPLGQLVRGLVDHGYEGNFDVELTGCEIELAGYDAVLESSLRQFDQWVGSAEPR